jgi:threonine dehydrogenase-like Zn-dependent dehydrogenase
MRAVQMFGWQTPPELRDVPEPEPGPGEVLLRVTGAGLCHSDSWEHGSPSRLIYRETNVDGLERASEALMRMLTDDTVGKTLVRVAEPTVAK